MSDELPRISSHLRTRSTSNQRDCDAFAESLWTLIESQDISSIIDAIASVGVLILGRFSEERLNVLHAIRDELYRQGYKPIVFDSEKPSSKDLVETVQTLAHLCCFAIADLTDAKSVLQELQAFVPAVSMPVQLVIQSDDQPPTVILDLLKYPWVLPIYPYPNQIMLLTHIVEAIIIPAEKKVQEMRQMKAAIRQ